jgi:hypothetical protein
MIEPRHFIEFRPGMRRLLEDAIESLILLLDEIDGDEGAEDERDFENGHDAEPDADSEEDDALDRDLSPDLGPLFTMDHSLQGANIEASPRESDISTCATVARPSAGRTEKA